MSTTKRILVAVDDSDASAKAVSYLGHVLAGADDCRIRLFHVVEPIGPPWISVHGDQTTELPAAADDPEARLIQEAKERSGPLFERMVEALTDAGVDRDCLESSWFIASREDSLAHEVLQLAREQDYSTVVVGRTALPWYRELFRQHLGERLVKKAEGLSVWVVE